MYFNPKLPFLAITMHKYLLHTCCGPCATACIETLLQNGIKPTLFFDNPNIAPNEEREKRRETLHSVAKHYNIDVIDGYTPHEKWLYSIKGLENCKEGEERCAKCFLYNASLTYQKAKELNFDVFSTSLTVSRFKNSQKIFKEFGKFNGFIEDDFKKNAGFERSCKLSKELGLYRQHYCGCEFSIYNSDDKE